MLGVGHPTRHGPTGVPHAPALSIAHQDDTEPADLGDVRALDGEAPNDGLGEVDDVAAVVDTRAPELLGRAERRVEREVVADVRRERGGPGRRRVGASEDERREAVDDREVVGVEDAIEGGVIERLLVSHEPTSGFEHRLVGKVGSRHQSSGVAVFIVIVPGVARPGGGVGENAAMHIRTFEPRDADAVVALWGACALTRPWNDPRLDIARKLAVADDLFLVGEIGPGDGLGRAEGEIVASVMAGYDGHRGWVNYLAVDPARRHQGLGAAMLAEAERRLAARGCPKLNLQVRTSNAEAVAFYERLGFARDDVVGLGKRLVHDDPPGA